MASQGTKTKELVTSTNSQPATRQDRTQAGTNLLGKNQR